MGRTAAASRVAAIGDSMVGARVSSGVCKSGRLRVLGVVGGDGHERAKGEGGRKSRSRPSFGKKFLFWFINLYLYLLYYYLWGLSTSVKIS